MINYMIGEVEMVLFENGTKMTLAEYEAAKAQTAAEDEARGYAERKAAFSAHHACQGFWGICA